MKGNFRIIHKKMDGESAYRIHEVYYNEKGKIANWAKLPFKPSGSTTHYRTTSAFSGALSACRF